MRYRTIKGLTLAAIACFILVCIYSISYISSPSSQDVYHPPVDNRDPVKDAIEDKLSADDVNIPESNNSTSLTDYRVHIFYYPWYGNLANDGRYLHWNHRYLPDWHKSSHKWPTGRHEPPHDIGASFYPRLGPYSSSDAVIVNDHMRQIKDSGAGVVVVSWYPKGSADDEGYDVDRLMPLILSQAHHYSLKVCLHIEPYKDRTVHTLRQDLEYIHKEYSSHPAYYTQPSHVGVSKNNLPLFYIYDSYLTSKHEWQKLLQAGGDLSVRGTHLDALFVALLVESSHLTDIHFSGFDGLYTYFAADGFSYGSTWRNWGRLAELSRERRLLFIPCVAPGYDDLRIRPWNSASTRDRELGSYYERSWAAAVKSRPPLVAVTSFNEWGEGTQIEEAVPYSYKKGKDTIKYNDYEPHAPDYYIKLTNKGCQQFRQRHRDRFM